jgi:ABC-type multidrug transport system permease subunit
MSPARKVFLLGLNDLRLTLNDRASFLWMLLLPLAFMWFFGHLGGGSDEPLRITLTVENRDDGWLSQALLRELDTETLRLQPVEETTAEERVRTLVIPEGFTAGVLAGDQQTLELISEPKSNAEFGVGAQMHTVRVIARVLARLVELEAGDAGPPTPELFRSLGERPPLVRLQVSTAGRGRPVPSGRNQSVPGTLTFTVLMMTLIYGGVFLTLEKRTGMLRRQATLPVSRRQIFFGKLMGRLLVAGLQVIVLVLAGRFLFGISWGASPLGLALVLTTYTLAVAALSTLLGAVLRTPEQASGVGWLLSMVLAALGGCWWPSEVMPRWLWLGAHALPTAWAMDAFHSLISYGRGLEAVLLPGAVLTGFAMLFSILGARLLQVD